MIWWTTFLAPTLGDERRLQRTSGICVCSVWHQLCTPVFFFFVTPVCASSPDPTYMEGDTLS